MLVFLHPLLFPIQEAGCELFGDAVGGKGKVNTAKTAGPMTGWASENLKGKMSSLQEDTHKISYAMSLQNLIMKVPFNFHMFCSLLSMSILTFLISDVTKKGHRQSYKEKIDSFYYFIN